MNPESPKTIIPASTISGRLNASPATAAWNATLSATEKYGWFIKVMVVPSTVSAGQIKVAKTTCADSRVA